MARLALAAASCLFGLGCATAHNYLGRNEPRYAGGHAPAQGRAMPSALRIVTFNIEYAKRMPPAIRALREHPALRDADLVLLQEMDAASVEAVAGAAGLNYVYYPGSRHPGTGRDLGNAVLTPWPIEEDWKVLLPHTSRILRQGRAAVGARVRIGGRAIRVYSVHFGSPLGISGGQRRAQAEAVLADAGQGADPVVIGGDLNSEGLGKAFVAEGFQWPTKHVGGSRGSYSFDHVFARGLGPGEARAGVARDVAASDHRPVWALLAFAPAP
jgi:endonuclease/exonuclease/phosphatase family metal-dependent hydrolase